jgi:hypothetical protein
MNDDLKDLREGDTVWFRVRMNKSLRYGGRWLAGTVESAPVGTRVTVYEEELRVDLRDVRRRGPNAELLAECRRRIELTSKDERVINGETADAATLLSELLASLEPPKD